MIIIGQTKKMRKVKDDGGDDGRQLIKNLNIYNRKMKIKIQSKIQMSSVAGKKRSHD